MAEPPAKRHKPAAPSALEKRAELDALMAPIAEKKRSLERQREELERQREELARQQAELQRQEGVLARSLGPLQAEHDRLDSYLQLVHARPTPVPAGLPADAPPTILLAAQRRLAVAGIGAARLGAGSTLSSDIAEMVAFHVRGFDHEGEAAKVEEHGEKAAAARLQFRPAALPAAGEKPEATGFLLEGHPDASFDGVYTHDSEHEGWPVLSNAGGRYCYRYRTNDKWFLRDDFTPDDAACHAQIVAPQGPLPVGARAWKVAALIAGSKQLVEHTLTVTPLRTEAETTAAEQRHKAALVAAQAPKAALATEQLQNKTVSIEGHPQPRLNGVYTHDSTHEGWPVLKNAKGSYCYRRTPTDPLYNQWYLSTEFTPDKIRCFASISAPEGPLPVGAHTWWVWGDKEWQERTLTVTLQ